MRTFNIRLVFGKEENITSVAQVRQSNGSIDILFGKNNKDKITAIHDSQTGDYYIDIESDQLERIHKKILDLVEIATVRFFRAQSSFTNMKLGNYIYENCKICVYYDTLIAISGQSKNPFALRDLVYKILKSQILPIEEGGQTAEQLKRDLEVSEKRVDSMLAELQELEDLKEQLRYGTEKIEETTSKIRSLNEKMKVLEETLHSPSKEPQKPLGIKEKIFSLFKTRTKDVA